mgnify:FL=1
METHWKLADAKNKLSEVIRSALAVGPQVIERRGEEVVVLSRKDYARLTGETPSFKQALMNGPSLEGVELARERSRMREIDL